MAKLAYRKVNGKYRWVIDYQVYDEQKGDFVRKQILCEKQGATNKTLRNQLFSKYKEMEDEDLKNVKIRGKKIKQKQVPIDDAIKVFLDKKKKEVDLRKKMGGRQGISESTYVELSISLRTFSEYCQSNKIKSCLDFNVSKANKFREWVSVYNGRTNNGLTSSSKNKLLVNIKSFLNTFKYEEIPVFKDIEKLTHILKKFPVAQNSQFYFKAKQLVKIITKAIEHDIIQCKVTRESHDEGKKFNKTLPLKNDPILPHLLLVLFTGMRRNDALQLEWNNVNLVNESISYKAGKTNKVSTIPFTDADHPVSPTMVHILKAWEQLRGSDKFVLPHPKSLAPAELKNILAVFKKIINEPDLGYQNLRKTFESYAVTMGVPPAKAAFWVGHSTATAEKHYTAYAFGKVQGNSIEEAMGLKTLMTKINNGYIGIGEYKNLKLTKWSP